MVRDLLKMLAPCFALTLLVACDEDSDDGTGDTSSESDEADEQLVGPGDIQDRPLATIEFAVVDGQLRTQTMVSPVGFRAGLLGPGDVSAEVVSARFGAGNRMRLAAEFTNVTADSVFTNLEFRLSDRSSDGVRSTLPTVTTKWAAGEVGGEYWFDVEHPGGNFEFYIEVWGDPADSPGDQVYEWQVDEDGSRDDISNDEIRDFFRSVPDITESDWLYFEITSNSVNRQGAWCGRRADWYVDMYLKYAGAGQGAYGVAPGGYKYVRYYDSASWYPTPPDNISFFGRNCAGEDSMCLEWHIGNSEKEHMGVIPRGLSSLYPNNELYSNGWFGNRTKGTATIRIGPDRASTCGF